MSRIVDVIRRVVRQELAQTRDSRLGVVSAVFPHESEDDDNNYEVNVRLKYEALELKKIPVAADHMGMAAPLKEGDLVLVQFVNGDLHQPLVTSRFYHADERPPLHKAGEIVLEHRVSDTFNQLRFAADGTIFIQRDVTKREDNSKAKAGIKMGANGDIEIKAGDKIVITLTNDAKIMITADSKPISITCDILTLDGNMEVNGDLKVNKASHSTTISGNEISGV